MTIPTHIKLKIWICPKCRKFHESYIKLTKCGRCGYLRRKLPVIQMTLKCKRVMIMQDRDYLITRFLVAVASAWASARVEYMTRLPFRFNIAPVRSCATPNFLPTLTTLAIIISNMDLINTLYNGGQVIVKE